MHDPSKASVNPELEAFLRIKINGNMETRYSDMIYQPVQIEPGTTDSIYIIAVDITEHVLNRKTGEDHTNSTAGGFLLKRVPNRDL